MEEIVEPEDPEKQGEVSNKVIQQKFPRCLPYRAERQLCQIGQYKAPPKNSQQRERISRNLGL